MTEAANPYAAPTARVDDVPANSEAEAIRRAHINHEASIKAVGFLYYIGGVLTTLVGAGALYGAQGAAGVLIGVLLLVFAGGQFFAGWGVRVLRTSGQIVGCVVSAIGLLGFPIGTLINGYILYLFLSKKGRTIFASDYKDVIAATPHVKYRTSILTLIFVAVMVVLVVVAVGAGNYMLDGR